MGLGGLIVLIGGTSLSDVVHPLRRKRVTAVIVGVLWKIDLLIDVAENGSRSIHKAQAV